MKSDNFSFLFRLLPLHRRIQLLRELIEIYDDKARSCTTTLSDCNIHHLNFNGSQMESIIVQKICMENLLKITEQELKTALSSVSPFLDNFPRGAYRDILLRRYVDFQDWQEISSAMGFQNNDVFVFHEKALYAFFQHLKCNPSMTASITDSIGGGLYVS